MSYGWSVLGNTFSMSISSSISSRESSWMSLLTRGYSSSCTIFFIFFLKESLWELSIFTKGGFLSSPPPEDMWVTFLIGWAIGALLWDVVVFGVTVGDWELFSLEPFPFCLYDSLVFSIVSRSPTSRAGVLETLSSSSFRITLTKELLKPTTSRCYTKISLGSNPFTLSTYLRFRLWKWPTNSSILFIFLNMKSPTFQGRGMNCFFLFSWKKCNQ